MSNTQNATNDKTPRRLPRAQEVRRVGPSGNYWYAVELEKNLKRGGIKKVRFWKDSIALYRGDDGEVRAVEDRCAHRQLALTTGVVEGENIVCQYHGWAFNGCGRCVSVDHELGKNRTKLPKIQIKSYPVKHLYGLIWIFPGDPELAESVPLPHIPELCSDNPWPVAPIEVKIESHFSMIVENVCDFNHAYLHRRSSPFTQPVLNKYWTENETVNVLYDTSFRNSPIAKLFAQKSDLDQIHLWYQYPYQGSNIGGKYLHWLFMLPEDERTTRCFFFFLFGPIQVPGTKLNIPSVVKQPFLELVNKFYILPLLSEDQWALAAEQKGFDEHYDNPFYEMNPIVPEFQNLTIERYKTYQQHMLKRGLLKGSKKSRAQRVVAESADASLPAAE